MTWTLMGALAYGNQGLATLVVSGFETQEDAEAARQRFMEHWFGAAQNLVVVPMGTQESPPWPRR